MVLWCFLCKWRSDKYPRRSFHRFPTKKELRQKWLDILGKSNATVGERTSLCCIHFEEDCFRYGLVMGKKILRGGSLPTLRLTKDEIGNQTVIPIQVINPLENSMVHILPTSHPTENYVKEEPTYAMNDNVQNNEVPIEYSPLTISATKRESYDYPSTTPSQALIGIKPFIHNPSFALNTESQSSGLVHAPSIPKGDSSNSSKISPREESSFFTFFRYIHSDYLMLSAKGQKDFKRKCLDILHTMLNDEFTKRQPNKSHRDNISNSTSVSQDDKDVIPLVDHDYVLTK